VGPKADVFSLALPLYHALAPRPREHLPAGAVDAFVAYRATHGPIGPDANGLSTSELADLAPHFARWLHYAPDARPSADELRSELSVLTRRAEQRARLLSLMRWLVPTLVAIVTLFSTVVYTLSREASLQRGEAAHARERAAQARERADTFYASYTVEEARRRELEADVQRLEREYQSSRLTRDELAQRLAQVESELAVLADHQRTLLIKLKQESDAKSELREQHEKLRAANAELSTRADQLAGELDRQRTHRNAAEDKAAAAQAALESTQRRLEQAMTRIEQLQSRLSALVNAKAKGASPPNRLTAAKPEL